MTPEMIFQLRKIKSVKDASVKDSSHIYSISPRFLAREPHGSAETAAALGYGNLNTTQVHLQFNDTDLREAYDKVF